MKKGEHKTFASVKDNSHFLDPYSYDSVDVGPSPIKPSFTGEPEAKRKYNSDHAHQ